MDQMLLFTTCTLLREHSDKFLCEQNRVSGTPCEGIEFRIKTQESERHVQGKQQIARQHKVLSERVLSRSSLGMQRYEEGWGRGMEANWNECWKHLPVGGHSRYIFKDNADAFILCATGCSRGSKWISFLPCQRDLVLFLFSFMFSSCGSCSGSAKWWQSQQTLLS